MLRLQTDRKDVDAQLHAGCHLPVYSGESGRHGDLHEGHGEMEEEAGVADAGDQQRRAEQHVYHRDRRQRRPVK